MIPPDFGLYVGWFTTKQGAINIHVRGLNEHSTEKITWKECRKSGDRCVKVKLIYIEPDNHNQKSYVPTIRRAK